MNTYIIQFLPVVIFLLSLCVPISIAVWIRHQRKTRRSPLTYQMLRSPGESISQRIDLLSEDIDTCMTFSGIAPLVCYSMYLTSRHLSKSEVSPGALALVAVGSLVYFGVRLNKALKQRHNEQLGLDCERSVGQELNQLMLEGGRVYHDFQADNFNIDHIVIGGNGIFAIETKGRAKPNRGKGSDDARVIYDGESLQFPTWSETEPLEQAKRQAAWLSTWITKAVGEKVVVKAGLALPGWYVERKRGDFLVFNGRNPQFLLKLQTETSLSPQMIQRITHQIEQRCRDIEPRAYRK